jgi:hypothetical protein
MLRLIGQRVNALLIVYLATAPKAATNRAFVSGEVKQYCTYAQKCAVETSA